MSSDKYCTTMVNNVDATFEKKELNLKSECVTPLKYGYRPDLDCTGELISDGVQWYQEVIGSLLWAI